MAIRAFGKASFEGFYGFVCPKGYPVPPALTWGCDYSFLSFQASSLDAFLLPATHFLIRKQSFFSYPCLFPHCLRIFFLPIR